MAAKKNNGRIKGTQGAFGKRRQSLTVVTLALSVVVVLVASYGIIQILERRAHSAAEKLVGEVVTHIDEKMNYVTELTRNESVSAHENLYSPEVLEQIVYDFVEKNEFVYGSTIAFEPDVFPERGRSFAPYSWITEDGKVHSRQLGTETDYYTEEWYAETKKSGNEFWSEPYFDEGGAKIMMCTFSVPLKDDNGNLVAVMTADVGLADLQQYVSEINPYRDSFITLRSRNGSILTDNGADNAAESGNIIIKGVSETGWTVELNVPFTYLVRGDLNVYLFIGIIVLFAILFIFFVNRLFTKLQQRSEKEYMSVIDSISSGFSSIYLVDLNTNDTIVFRDPEKYAEVAGFDREGKFIEKIDKLIEYDGYPADRAMMHTEILPSVMREKLADQDRYEVRFRKEENGKPRWNEMHVFVLERDAQGVPVSVVTAFDDADESVLKEKREQETLANALEAAQAASKAKTDFLFSMSHDIRTPMNAIIGFTNMAKKHIDDRDRVLDCLEKTQQSGGLLLTLINSVLDVSRIESGHAKVEESPADVYHSFTAIKETLTELAASRDISISFETGEIKDRYVYCDLDRCNRIFVNIISNAIKYTNGGGYVKVKCEQVECDREGYGNYRYTFEDNGIGMSEEFQKHVFEQFAREKTSTVSGIEGSGLGLAVCKSFTELMGGTIECESTLGKGSVFTVTLPLRIQETKRYVDPFTREEVCAAEEQEHSGPVILKGRKALLVEDNELNREIATELLEEEGIIVESAENGELAVSAVKEKGTDYYDFILMDIQMPVMNGYEATKAIREMPGGENIPVIALSANAFAEDRRASKAAGMNDHVAKPVNVQELFAILARFMQ